MLSQVSHWIDIVSAAVDLILLLRVLTLRLYRTYLFITLFCVLGVFFDGVEFWLGIDSPEFRRVSVYITFLFAFVFPVTAWDVFEELKTQLANLRRLAITRTVTSLLLITIFGLILSGFLESGDDPTGLAFLGALGLIVSTGSATGSLAFLWVMHRGMRMQKIEPPRNTWVWLIFFELILAVQVIDYFYALIGEFVNQTVRQSLWIGLTSVTICITAWCVLKLKAMPSDVPSRPVDANS